MFDKINIGTAPNSGDGDSLRDAFSKVNDNYDDTYTKEEVDTKITNAVEGIDVDLTDYYNKGEVDTLYNDLYDEIDSVFYDLTLDEVVLNGDGLATTGITFTGVGDLTVDGGEYEIINMPNPDTPAYPKFSLHVDGTVTTNNRIRIRKGNGKDIVFADNEGGVITAWNDVNWTKLKFEDATIRSEVTIPNKSGTIALLEDISGGGIEDAPSDGKTYARKDASWTELEQSEPGVVFTKVGSLTDRGWYKLDKNNTRNFSCGNSDRGSIMLGMWTKNYAPSDVFNFFQTGSYNIIGGTDCIATGDNCLVGGTNSFNMGTTDNNAIIWGQLCRTTRSNSSAFGLGLEQRGLSSGSNNPTTLVGSYNNLYIGGDNTEIAGQRFVVGIGTAEEDRKDGFFVHSSGEVVAPNLTNDVINNSDNDTILVTRDWVLSNSSGGGSQTHSEVVGGTNPVVNHNFGTREVIVSVIENATGEMVFATYTVTENTIVFEGDFTEDELFVTVKN